MVPIDIDAPVTQVQFAELVGVSQQAVSQLVGAGVFVDGEPARQWLQCYLARLREQAAGRSQALAIQRSALARSQREGQEIKNASVRKEFAPIAVLAEALNMASSGVGNRMEALRGDLRRRCPALSEAVLSVIDDMLVDARAEWLRATGSLVVTDLVAISDDEPADDDAVDSDGQQLPDDPEEGRA